MKNISIIMICMLASILSSCDTESTENVSGITEFAVIENEAFTLIAVGDSFTPSAIATEGGVELPVTVDSNLNTNVPGVYEVSYTAVNSDGFPASSSQTVIVHDPSIVGTDVTGNIVDANNASRTGTITLVEGTTSIFLASDFGFGGIFPVYFQMDGDVISELPQTYSFSATQVDLTYDPVTKVFTTLIHPYGFDYTFKYQ